MTIAGHDISPLTPPRSRRTATIFWIVTALFCLQVGFTAYAQLALPQVAEAFTRLGFPDYFRVQLAIAKLIGIIALLTPVPAPIKEWAYAGFGITLASAIIAHLAVGDGPEAWGWAAATAVLWTMSYASWRHPRSGPPGPEAITTIAHPNILSPTSVAGLPLVPSRSNRAIID